MNTLAEYRKLTTDKVLVGVLDTIVKESPIMARLPWKNFEGNSLKFNIEKAMAGVSYYTVGDVWAEGANAWAQGSVSLTTMGGDVDTDKFAIKTKGDINDVRAINIEGKAKAMAHQFDKDFAYGKCYTGGSALVFPGLLYWIGNYENADLNTTDLDAINNEQVVANNAISAVLSLTKMDELIDAIKPGVADCLIMDRRTRRYLNYLARTTSSSPIRIAQDEFGKFIALYNEIPVLVNDFMQDNMPNNSSSVLTLVGAYDYDKARVADYDNSVILAVRFSESDGVCGVQNGAMEHEDLGELETKRAYRNRFAWDLSVVMLGKKCAAVLTGVIDA